MVGIYLEHSQRIVWSGWLDGFGCLGRCGVIGLQHDSFICHFIMEFRIQNIFCYLVLMIWEK